MNIFAVDYDPEVAAVMLVDRHVVKMILESSQLLCSAHHCCGDLADRPSDFFRKSWMHHPCTKWTVKSLGNYVWLARHNLALCREYTFRYGRIHKLERDGLPQWLLANPPLLPDLGLTRFAEVTGDIREADPVETYRRYYRETKRHLWRWTRRAPPEWTDEKNA
jgi:hypothetical protein